MEQEIQPNVLDLIKHERRSDFIKQLIFRHLFPRFVHSFVIFGIFKEPWGLKLGVLTVSFNHRTVINKPLARWRLTTVSTTTTATATATADTTTRIF